MMLKRFFILLCIVISVVCAFGQEPEDDGRITSFNAYVVGNKVLLLWAVNNNGANPTDFTIERDNVQIAELGGNVFFYINTLSEPGEYAYKLTLYTDEGEESAETDILVDELPEPNPYNLPTQFQYERVGENSIVLHWNLYEEEEALSPIQYEIMRNGSPLDLPDSSLSYLDLDLPIEEELTYDLIARYEDGYEYVMEPLIVVLYDLNAPLIPSDDIEYRTLTLDDGVSPYPMNPVNFQAKRYSADNMVRLSWEMPDRALEPKAFEIKCNGEVIFEGRGHIRTFDHQGIGEDELLRYELKPIYDDYWLLRNLDGMILWLDAGDCE